MKTYNAPRLASKDTILVSTRAFFVGGGDPKNTDAIEAVSPGSVGFQL